MDIQLLLSIFLLGMMVKDNSSDKESETIFQFNERKKDK